MSKTCLSPEMCVTQSGVGMRVRIEVGRRRKKREEEGLSTSNHRRRRRKRTARELPCDLCMFPDTTTQGVTRGIRVSDPYPHIQ